MEGSSVVQRSVDTVITDVVSELVFNLVESSTDELLSRMALTVIAQLAKCSDSSVRFDSSKKELIVLRVKAKLIEIRTAEIDASFQAPVKKLECVRMYLTLDSKAPENLAVVNRMLGANKTKGELQEDAGVAGVEFLLTTELKSLVDAIIAMQRKILELKTTILQKMRAEKEQYQLTSIEKECAQYLHREAAEANDKLRVIVKKLETMEKENFKNIDFFLGSLELDIAWLKLLEDGG